MIKNKGIHYMMDYDNILKSEYIDTKTYVI